MDLKATGLHTFRIQEHKPMLTGLTTRITEAAKLLLTIV